MIRAARQAGTESSGSVFVFGKERRKRVGRASYVLECLQSAQIHVSSATPCAAVKHRAGNAGRISLLEWAGRCPRTAMPQDGKDTYSRS